MAVPMLLLLAIVEPLAIVELLQGFHRRLLLPSLSALQPQERFADLQRAAQMISLQCSDWADLKDCATRSATPHLDPG